MASTIRQSGPDTEAPPTTTWEYMALNFGVYTSVSVEILLPFSYTFCSYTQLEGVWLCVGDGEMGDGGGEGGAGDGDHLAGWGRLRPNLQLEPYMVWGGLLPSLG